MALPHLPLVQWGEHYPIGAVKVGHQHLQNVLNLQEAKREKQGQGEKEKSGLERGKRVEEGRTDGFKETESWRREKGINSLACAISPNGHSLPCQRLKSTQTDRQMEKSPERCTHIE